MKYLKRIDEELNRQTYLNASKKLADLKHFNRSKKLKDWSETSQWGVKKKKYSKFGEIDVLFPDKYKSRKGTYYISFFLDDFAFDDQDIEDDKEGYFHLCIGLIPKDQESYDAIKDLGISEFNSVYWAFTIEILFDVSSGNMVFKDGKLYSPDSPAKIANRKSALTLKRIIVNAIGDPNYNYPVKYRQNSPESNLHDEINRIFAHDYSLGIDYGFDAEGLADYIKTISVNSFYQD